MNEVLFRKLFHELNIAHETGNLNDYLKSVSPKELLLATRDTYTLLHCAYDKRIILKLVSVGIDINQQGNGCETPIMFRVRYDDDVDVISLMIALGSNLALRNSAYLSALEIAILNTKFTVAKCLISNGSRLASVHELILKQCDSSSSLILFENGVINCRDVIVTLLGLKKFRKLSALRKIDRFLIKQELAVEIWSTREEKLWQ